MSAQTITDKDLEARFVVSLEKSHALLNNLNLNDRTISSLEGCNSDEKSFWLTGAKKWMQHL